MTITLSPNFHIIKAFSLQLDDRGGNDDWTIARCRILNACQNSQQGNIQELDAPAWATLKLVITSNREIYSPPDWTWMHWDPARRLQTVPQKHLVDIYHKNQNLHSTSVNCFRKKQRLNIYQRNQNLHCCHQILLATRETGFILFLSKFWPSVSSPASHPKAFALLPPKLANTKVRIHIVAIEVVLWPSVFKIFFVGMRPLCCGTVPYAQARTRHAQTNSNQKLIKKAMHAE